MPEARAYEIISEFAEEQIDSLVLTGGEPTLHPAIIRIAEFARTGGIPRVSLCTNGCIPDPYMEKKILEFPFSGLTVSVDSHKDDIHDDFRGKKGALRKTIAFLKQLKLRRRPVTAHVTVHRENLDHVEDTVAFCREFCSEVTIGSIHNYPSLLEDSHLLAYQTKLENLKANYYMEPEVTCVGFESPCVFSDCPDGKNLRIVNRKGEVTPCCWRGNPGDASTVR
jgi:MoaA/NifB/PqqE/SkfB family radical SAM enzyme